MTNGFMKGPRQIGNSLKEFFGDKDEGMRRKFALAGAVVCGAAAATFMITAGLPVATLAIVFGSIGALGIGMGYSLGAAEMSGGDMEEMGKAALTGAVVGGAIGSTSLAGVAAAAGWFAGSYLYKAGSYLSSQLSHANRPPMHARGVEARNDLGA